jgi:hypothetical protein
MIKKTTMIITAVFIAMTVIGQERKSTEVAKYNNSILGVKAIIELVEADEGNYHTFTIMAKDAGYTAITVYAGLVFSGDAYQVFKTQFAEAVAIKKPGATVSTWTGVDSAGDEYILTRSGGAILLEKKYKDGTGTILYGTSKKVLKFMEENDKLFSNE